MKTKFLVEVKEETWTEYVVEAENAEEAVSRLTGPHHLGEVFPRES